MIAAYTHTAIQPATITISGKQVAQTHGHCLCYVWGFTRAHTHTRTHRTHTRVAPGSMQQKVLANAAWAICSPSPAYVLPVSWSCNCCGTSVAHAPKPTLPGPVLLSFLLALINYVNSLNASLFYLHMFLPVCLFVTEGREPGMSFQ